jgi:hypothetical protein
VRFALHTGGNRTSRRLGFGACADFPRARFSKSAARARVRGIHEPFYFGVAGDTAAQVDLEHSLAAHLPLVRLRTGDRLRRSAVVADEEAYDGGASNSDAVAIGLERTGRLVTSAAVLFAVAIGAFAVSEIVFIKESGSARRWRC